MKVLRRRKDGVVQHYHIRHVARRVINKLRPYSEKVVLAGSIRRNKTGNDVDIVVVPKDKAKIAMALDSMGRIKSRGDEQIFADIDKVQVDVFFADPKEFGAQLMTRTGPAGANIANRALAKSKGMLLNQHGLFKGNRMIAGATEASIYKALGKTYRPPEDRGTLRISERPKAIGTSWAGDKYMHGPRRHLPSKYSEFRLGKVFKSGKRIVWGKNKFTGKWEVQSVLRPRRG